MKCKKEILEIVKVKGWKYVSEFEKLSEDIIEEYQDEVWWDAISCQQKLSESFMIKFQDKINWRWISSFQVLSEDFIRQNIDRLDMPHISWCQTLSEEFIVEFIPAPRHKHSSSSIKYAFFATRSFMNLGLPPP